MNTFDSTTLMLLLLAFIALVVLIFIFKKVVIFLLSLVVLAGLLYYVFVVSNLVRQPQKHAKYSIENIKKQNCENMLNHKDSVKCFSIITPIYNDIHKRYTEQELLKYEKNPLEYYKLVNDSMKRNKKKIIKNLAKAKEQKMWNNFVKEVKNSYNSKELTH